MAAYRHKRASHARDISGRASDAALDGTGVELCDAHAEPVALRCGLRRWAGEAR
jgi:hypothetical protein